MNYCSIFSCINCSNIKLKLGQWFSFSGICKYSRYQLYIIYEINWTWNVYRTYLCIKWKIVQIIRAREIIVNLCTYLPTCCILFMAIITLYIDESHFEATIMVALTAMLVLYTLFQSISENMPPTAYLKLLDIWLIFGLIMPFIIFIIEISWELMKQRERNSVRNMYHYTKVNCKIIFQIGIPIICGIFSILYVIIVFMKYYQF